MTVHHGKVLQWTAAVSAIQTMVDTYGVQLSPQLSTIAQATPMLSNIGQAKSPVGLQM